MEYGRLESSVKDHTEHMARYTHDLSLIEKEKKDKMKESHLLFKKSSAMQTEYDFTRKKRDNLKCDLEMQKEWAETRRQKLIE